MSMHIHPEVAEGLASGQPVVALESTVLTHGLPHGEGALENLGVARQLERAIRDQGAIPATIALLDGLIWVGLSTEQLTRLCSAPSPRKLSARDLAIASAQGGTGGTTVAATVRVAYAAGISVFATGGIGGVHRGWQDSLDISADLSALATTPICCVSAGAKSLLDLGATVELLETLGIATVGVGTDALPHFTAKGTGAPRLPHRMDDPALLARAFRLHSSLCESAFLVFQNPPAEHALPAELSDVWTSQAVAEARDAGATGSLETPFVLRRIAELSSGRSVLANVALLTENASLAARIARHLSSL